MNRRSFLRAAAAGTAAAWPRLARAVPPKMRITRVRFYETRTGRKPMINQSMHVVTVETDAGITGIGEGGSKELVEQCAGLIIGEDPSRIERLWQMMYRGLFYPAGREKLHALGALDMALWDIKGKALGVPVYELLGGLSRDHIECYATGFPGRGSPKERAQACLAAGFRAFRIAVSDPGGSGFDGRRAVRKTFQDCVLAKEGVGKDGDWMVDYHTRLDMADAVRLSTLIEPLEPYFCEDLVRSENPGVYRTLRGQVKVPIALGEQFGDRWDFNELVEQHLVDHSRVTLPNCGGITEFMKIAALCETHYVGLAPHFTGPIATAALVHCCGVFPDAVLMEMTSGGKFDAPHLPQHHDFRAGKLYPRKDPGLGVVFDPKGAQLVAEITAPSKRLLMLRRPDGSLVND